MYSSAQKKGFPSVSLKCIKGCKFSMETTGKCYVPEDKWKSTEPEMEWMSGDSMELNDRELNNINSGDETESDEATNDSDENFVLQKSLFYCKQFHIVRTLESF